MSRAKVHDNSDAVSLFPFLAVLLCTMGALIVVLVGVTRLSRDQALEQVAAQEAAKPPSEPTPEADEARRQLDEATAYLAKLNEVRTQAEQQLTSDQSRLSHLEDHIRRLQEQLDSLRLAAAELQGMEEEHYDDREQAERELARLEQLIGDSRKTIEELREETQSRQPSYAIVPYKGPNGTSRRPMYIECRRDEVVLQPEGIRLTPDDFQPPIGPGNPLASALRAGREQIQRGGSAAGDALPADPYPLILVRPDGIVAYYRVRDAIESWDSDFGYEFVDGDWELKFPPANPQIAAVEYQAVETARARLRMLAAAAPRAYGAYRSARGSFDLDDESRDDAGGSFGDGDGNTHSIGSIAGSEFGDKSDGQFFVPATDDGQGGLGGHGAGGNGETTSAGPARSGPANDAGQVASVAPGVDRGVTANSNASGRANGDGRSAGQPLDPDAVGEETSAGVAAIGSAAGQTAATSGALSEGASPANSAAGTAGSASASSAGGSPDSQGTGAAPNDANTPTSVVMNAATQPPSNRSAPVASPKVRGLDWAIGNPNPGAVAIRRPIQVIVRHDRLAILPESNGSTEPASEGREILLNGPTEHAVDEFVSALRQHVEQWGMAGSGLYWRPVLELNVGPDGGGRADDLARLLKYSGLELQTPSVATQSDGEADSATR